jgi:hypothetical protein
MGVLQKLASVIQNIFMQQFALSKGFIKQIEGYGKEDKHLLKYIKTNRNMFERWINMNKDFGNQPSIDDYVYITNNLERICSQTAVTQQTPNGIQINFKTEPWTVVDPYVNNYVKIRDDYRAAAQAKYQDTDFAYAPAPVQQINNSLARQLMNVYTKGVRAPGTWGDIQLSKKKVNV